MIGYAGVWWGQMAAFVGQMVACSVGGRWERYMYPRGGSYAREARGVVVGEALGVSKRVGYVFGWYTCSRSYTCACACACSMYMWSESGMRGRTRSGGDGSDTCGRIGTPTVRVSKRVGILSVGIRGPGAIHVIRERHAWSHAVGGRYTRSHTMRARGARGRSEQSVSGVLKRVGILC